MGVGITLIFTLIMNHQNLDHDAEQQAANRLAHTRQMAYTRFDQLARKAIDVSEPLVPKSGGLPFGPNSFLSGPLPLHRSSAQPPATHH